MDAARKCKGCSQLFSSVDRKPMLLSCFHTACEGCAAVCPSCFAQNSAGQRFDRSLLDILEAEEIQCDGPRCPRLATVLCDSHWRAYCDSCTNSACTCGKVRFLEPTMDISGYLDHKLRKKRASAPENVKIKFMFTAQKTNREKLALLRLLAITPLCQVCKNPAQPPNLVRTERQCDYWCNGCVTKCREGISWHFPLTSDSPSQELKNQIRLYLKNIGVHCVPESSPLYDQLRNLLPSGLLYDLAQVAYTAFNISHTDLWPQAMRCPTCSITYPLNFFQLFPCHQVYHCICQRCKDKLILRKETKVVCQMDGFSYDITSLKNLMG